MIDRAIFEDLQTKIDEESAVRDVSKMMIWRRITCPLHRTVNKLTCRDRSSMKLSRHLPEKVFHPLLTAS